MRCPDITDVAPDGAVLMAKPWSDNPAHDYMRYVLVWRNPDKYTHPYIVCGDNLDCGDYFGVITYDDLAKAVEAFRQRGTTPWV